MRFRLTLRMLLFSVFVVAALFARYSYVQNRYRVLEDAGARIVYYWEQPSLKQEELRVFRASGDSPGELRITFRSLLTSPTERSWLEFGNSLMIGDEVTTIVVDAKSFDSTVLTHANEIDMPCLKHILVNNASTIPDSPDPKVTSLIQSLECEFPSVPVHPQYERMLEE